MRRFDRPMRLKDGGQPAVSGGDKSTLTSSATVHTCLSFPQFKAEQFQSVIQTHLINNQFHLDSGQNKSDPASREYVAQLVWLVM